jgi:tetratricopeptide (TPR) repeat protein
MNDMIRFAHPEYLYGLLLIPLLIGLYLWSAHSRKLILRRFSNPAILQQLIPSLTRYKRGVKLFLITTAFALLIIALANPQIGTKMEKVKRQGVDILIALDVSNSMKAEDFKPNRLENAKRQISLMLDRLENDRIGLIVFAGTSYLQLPLTTDYSAARLFLSTIDTDIVPVQGTAIGSAIRLAMKSFVKGEKKFRVIIVISDGENHEDDAIAAAKDAADDGVVVHTIGMGSPAGIPIPEYQNGVAAGFKKDSDGNVVITKLDEQALQQIASAGKGKYVQATSSQNEMETLFREVQSMEKKDFGANVFTDFEDRFQYPLGAALFLLMIDFFISERKSNWSGKWNWSTLLGRAAVILFLLTSLDVSAESERSLIKQGNTQYKKKEFADSEASYRKALEKKKELREAVFNLGDAMYKQGRFSESADQFRLAASNAPDAASRASAYHNLGNAMLKEKKFQESIEAYKQGLKLNPSDQDTKYNLEYARRLLQQQQQKQQQPKQKDNQKDQQKKQEQKQDQQQDQKQDQKQEPQQPKKDQISKQDAERILEALKNEEKNVRKKLQKKPAAKVKVDKDW